MGTLRIPLKESLADTLAEAEHALPAAIRDYANANGLFTEEVAASFQGVKKFKGNPHLIYTLDRMKRK